MQKTKNWKYLCIFSPGPSPLKFYYIKHLCKMEQLRKFKFFRFFHYKTILFSSESEFSMKNVFFWGTSCWCSSKIKKLGGAIISYNCRLWAPLQLFPILYRKCINSYKNWKINIFMFSGLSPEIFKLQRPTIPHFNLWNKLFWPPTL